MEDGGRRRSGGEDWRFSRFSRSNPLGGKKVFGLADGESVWLVLSIGPVAVLSPLKQYSVHFYDHTTPERGFC